MLTSFRSFIAVGLVASASLTAGAALAQDMVEIVPPVTELIDPIDVIDATDIVTPVVDVVDAGAAVVVVVGFGVLFDVVTNFIQGQVLALLTTGTTVWAPRLCGCSSKEIRANTASSCIKTRSGQQEKRRGRWPNTSWTT